ncbi:MAG: class I SAM-dependent methyltransferase [Sideroxydans sp.]|nr:class I SAM-dependent methyltransferase [Sideroxydans sp.]
MMARITCAEAMERGRVCQANIYDLNRHDVADWQLAWVWCLAQVAPDGPAVECGIAHGGSLATWAPAREGRGPIYAVDVKFRDGVMERLAGYGYEIEALLMPSWEAPAHIDGQVAFCFIDANHSESGFPRDIAVWPGKIAPGGVLAFHDYDVWKPNVVVKKYVDAWQERARWHYLGQIGALIAFRRPEEG